MGDTTTDGVPHFCFGAMEYRLTIYAQRSPTNTDETTPLTPAAGAIHSDAFKVATTTSAGAGFMPYLDDVQCQPCRVKLPDCVTEVGQCSVTLLDKRYNNAGNAQRWITAFLGDSNGRLRELGRRAVIESSDDGVTWTVFFIGRVKAFRQTDDITYAVELREAGDELKQPAFTVRPDVSYCVTQTLLPLGVTDAMGALPAAIPITGRIAPIKASNERQIDIDRNQWGRNDNIFTSTLNGMIALMSGVDGGALYGDRLGGARCLVQNLTTGQSGELAVRWVKAETMAFVFRTRHAETVWVENLQSSGSLPFTVANLNAGDRVKFSIYGINQRKALSKGEEQSFWLANVNVGQVFKDACSGKFLAINDLELGIDEAAFDALIATGNLPTATFRIDGPIELKKFIEEHICQPYGLAYAVQPKNVGGVLKSVIVPFKTSLPTSLPSLTITEGDIVADQSPQWEPGQPLGTVQINFYGDSTADLKTLKKFGDGDPNGPAAVAINTTEYGQAYADPSDPHAPGKDLVIDALGVRESLVQSADPSQQASVQRASRTALALLTQFVTRFRNGPPTVTLACVRSETVKALQVGDWVLVNIDTLPNPSTHLRGGVRLMQVMHKAESPGACALELLDGALNATLAVPAISGVAIPGVDGASFTITTTEHVVVTFQYAFTPAGSSEPSSGSDLWKPGASMIVNATSAILGLPFAPAGTRLWARARAEAPSGGTLKLPSAWVVANAIDFAALPTPGTVTASGITDSAASLAWTNTNNTYRIQIGLASPSTDQLDVLTTLVAASTRYDLKGLNLNTSTSHKAGIRYIDNNGGYGEWSTVTFTAAGTGAALPIPTVELIIG